MHTRLKQSCNHPTCAKLVADKKRESEMEKRVRRWTKKKRYRLRLYCSRQKEKEIEHSDSTVLVSRTLRL
jgi:hypothetical protein